MRFMLTATMPHKPFNAAVKDGTAGAKLMKIIDAIKPETAYFTDRDGKRSAVLIVDMPDASKIPALAEPFFLAFEADIEFKCVMTLDDLKKSGLDEIGKKWS